MFRVYKPKNVVRIKAVQVTPENINELATNLMGRVHKQQLDADTKHMVLDVPTFDGILSFPVSSWIVRDDNNRLSLMSDEKFKQEYEAAVNRSAAATSN